MNVIGVSTHPHISVHVAVYDILPYVLYSTVSGIHERLRPTSRPPRWTSCKHCITPFSTTLRCSSNSSGSTPPALAGPIIHTIPRPRVQVPE